ncbi:8396_t:CDS:2, partial [Cetraspora pellucida]
MSETSKKIGGQPPSDLWDKHIKKDKKILKGHYKGTCNYCSYYKYKGSLQEFDEHLANNCAKLKEESKRFNIIGEELKLWVNTRWHTIYDCINSIANHKEVLEH